MVIKLRGVPTKLLILYTERNFQTATRHFLIYLNINDTYMAEIYTQCGKIN